MKAGSQHICRLLKGKWGGFRVLPFGDGLDMASLVCLAGRAFNKLISHFHLTISRVCRCRARTRSCSGLFFCATGRLHDGRCRLDLRASAALVFPEVLDEQSGELLRGRIVGRLVGPRVAWLEDCRWHSSSRSPRPTAAGEVFLVDHDVQYSPRLLVEVTVIRAREGAPPAWRSGPRRPAWSGL